jgi:hypothetical protein
MVAGQSFVEELLVASCVDVEEGSDALNRLCSYALCGPRRNSSLLIK